MNAPIPPHDPSQTDELVSAYLDGVAAPDEIEIVEASPELLAQVESMRSVSAMLGAPVAPPADAAREDHLAAAMGEFDRLFATDAGSDATVTPLPQAATAPIASSEQAAPAPGVTSLAAARERKRPRRLNMVAAAAAAVALLFAGVVAVGLNSGGESRDVVADTASAAADTATIESQSELVLPEETSATALNSTADSAAPDSDAMEEEAASDSEAMADAGARSEEAAEAVEADAEAAFAAPVEDAMDEAMEDEAAMDDAAGDAAASGPVGFLGNFDTVDELATAVADDLDGSPAAKIAKDRSAFLPMTDCAEVASERAGLNGATLLNTAILDDAAVELHATADGQILMLSTNDCAVIEVLPIP